jgi:hypothetical protein
MRISNPPTLKLRRATQGITNIEGYAMLFP